MWKDTEVSRRLGLAAPIIQGPFGGGISSVDLVVAVCEAGGLGSFGVHHLDADGIRDVAAQLRARTSRPFGGVEAGLRVLAYVKAGRGVRAIREHRGLPTTGVSHKASPLQPSPAPWPLSRLYAEVIHRGALPRMA